MSNSRLVQLLFQYNAMRHKYIVTGFVLARFPIAEGDISVILLTDELGLLRARVKGIRKPAAKLASALQTFAESDFSLVYGQYGWRLFGARIRHNWATILPFAQRTRVGRVVDLLIRLTPGEMQQSSLYETFAGFFQALNKFPEILHESIEQLAALRIMNMLGLDDGKLPENKDNLIYHSAVLQSFRERQHFYITRINRGIAASGL